MSGLSRQDYVKILDFYNIKIPATIQGIKDAADKVLSTKLCKCIKNINTPNNVASCSKSIFKSKGLRRGLFKCRKNRTVKYKKI